MLTVVYCIMSIAGCEMLHNTEWAYHVHIGIYRHSHYMVHVYNSGNGGIPSAGCPYS